MSSQVPRSLLTTEELLALSNFRRDRADNLDEALIDDFVGSYDVTLYGATGDGVTDDRPGIQSALDACGAAGGGTVFIPNGTYIVTRTSVGEEGCLYIPSNVTLMGESRNGAIIKLAAGQLGFTRPIRLNAVDDVRITNLTINGNKSAQSVEEHRANIFAQNCNRLHIDHVTSFNAAGDAFDIHQDCFDVVIEYCYGYGTDRSGVALNGGRQKRITIRNCQLTDNLAQQIDTEMDTGEHIEDVIVENCHLVSQLDYAITISGQNEGFQSDGFVIRNNVIEGCVFVVWAKNVRFENNKIITRATDLAQPLAITHKSEHVIVDGNYIEHNATSGLINPKACIDLEGTTTTDKPTRVLIKNNTLKTTRNDANGLYITSSLGVEVVGNTILGTASNTQFGVEVRPTEASASYQMQSVVVNSNHIVDFAKGVVASGVSGSTTVKDLQVCNNVFEKIDNTGFTVCIDIDADNFHVVRQATVIGNATIGVASMFGGTYGGWPVDIATLIGGARGDRGIYSMVGTPESALTEKIGAVVVRRDGASGLSLYVKESGAGSTGWKSISRAASSGTITCVAKASLADGDYLTIGDGIVAPKLYEFDVAGDGVTAGRVAVNVLVDTTATQVATTLANAINQNHPTLNAVQNGDGTITVTHKWPGAAGNVTMTENVTNAGFLVSGLTGGQG